MNDEEWLAGRGAEVIRLTSSIERERAVLRVARISAGAVVAEMLGEHIGRFSSVGTHAAYVIGVASSTTWLERRRGLTAPTAT